MYKEKRNKFLKFSNFQTRSNFANLPCCHIDIPTALPQFYLIILAVDFRLLFLRHPCRITTLANANASYIYHIPASCCQHHSDLTLLPSSLP
jgi:hypothetical protein